MTEVQIVLPPRDRDFLSESLRMLTRAICEAHPEIEGGYGLGGEFGYGETFENDVFSMQRYYWGDCTCGAMDTGPDEPERDCEPTCPMQLPNFRHKASGFEVRWYKWIGRGNELKNEPKDLDAVMTECLSSLSNGES